MTPVNPLSAPSAPAAWASAARQDRLRAPGREGRAQTVTAPVTAEPANAGSLRDRHCVRCGYGVAVRRRRLPARCAARASSRRATGSS